MRPKIRYHYGLRFHKVSGVKGPGSGVDGPRPNRNNAFPSRWATHLNYPTPTPNQPQLRRNDHAKAQYGQRDGRPNISAHGGYERLLSSSATVSTQFIAHSIDSVRKSVVMWSNTLSF